MTRRAITRQIGLVVAAMAGLSLPAAAWPFYASSEFAQSGFVLQAGGGRWAAERQGARQGQNARQGQGARQERQAGGPQMRREGRPEFYGRPMGPTGPAQRPSYIGAPPPSMVRPMNTPPGHLGDWLNHHQGLPVGQQEQLLRKEPAFRHLDPVEQEHVMGQLHQMNQMGGAQRERRLARAEILEHMAPEDRMQVHNAAQRLNAMPEERQTQVRLAFRDLRSVPEGQRDTVLDSARYQRNFSPDERQMLHNLLRVEPYEPSQ